MSALEQFKKHHASYVSRQAHQRRAERMRTLLETQDILGEDYTRSIDWEKAAIELRTLLEQHGMAALNTTVVTNLGDRKVTRVMRWRSLNFVSRDEARALAVGFVETYYSGEVVSVYQTPRDVEASYHGATYFTVKFVREF